MTDRLKANGKASGNVNLELARLNDRITTVAQVFNDSVMSLRSDIKKLDDRLHALLEEGIVAKLNERVLKVEDQLADFQNCRGEIHEIQIEVTRIDQRTKLFIYLGAAVFGPLTAWALIYIVSHIFGQ